ncbi:hypothetical protein HMPREF0290_0166 [Corynebacterium efficiens YS-314]|uniref:Integral membrane protein n=1 Tax=Corynebacterium efficiens (strain DSM 44549 / YS-314 / AJ 12310 / JCM 11189 / NBRC 100395) TaxID=196164 RepID=Q8FM07_COREF|nr:DUF3054 domain-containing protein [Corynebacterium efficiens]EEW51206.1 hypothetical protein HMPREF0290_0166 [Corynebacterium efficiens YS-314]BAC19510.1 conserved hypothetical protein [Corynebacterium efficiens YS-314]
MNRWLALLLDAIAIGLFALFARIAHQSEEMPLTAAGWFNTMLPFLAGVFLAYLVVILPLKARAEFIRPAGLSVWVFAVVIGLVFWGITNGEIPHWSFMVVATTASAILVLGWRALHRVIRK